MNSNFLKIQKKLFFTVIVFAFFSCASTPKNTQESSNITLEPTTEENVSEEQNQQEEIAQETPETSQTEENPSQESFFDENIESEKVDAEELPELPYQDETKTEEIQPINEEQNIYEPIPSSESQDDTKNSITEEPLIEQSEQTDSEQDFSNFQNDENQTTAENIDNQASTIEPDAQVEENNSLEQESEQLAENEKNLETEPQKEIKPSRSVDMHKNQYITIIYPGKGWIYQGNIDKDGNLDIRNKNFIFGGRKLGGKDQTFTLRSRTSGTYLLHFYKNDVLTGEYIDDYLEVNVDDLVPSSDEKIEAPSYAQIVPQKATITAQNMQNQKNIAENVAKISANSENEKNQESKVQEQQKNQNENKNESNVRTVIQNSSETEQLSSIENNTTNNEEKNSNISENIQAENTANTTLNAEQLLKKAQTEFNNKQYPQALESITKFFDKASSKLDEGLYLQGQILEQKSSVQNIKNAIESYDMVVKNYPSSRLWKNANKRSIFLKRFYINIR